MPHPNRPAVLLALIVAFFVVSAQQAAALETVSVTLIDFEVMGVPTSVTEGTVAFQVRNDGVVAHNLVVVKTDLAPDALPVNDETYLVEEGQLNIAARSIEMLTGETAKVSANLGPGNYVLICNNIATHYQAGMYQAFRVTAAPEPTATLPGAEPTPPGDGGPPASTATPATTVTDISRSGQGQQGGSSGWWMWAAPAALGAALVGLGAVGYRQARRRRQTIDA